MKKLFLPLILILLLIFAIVGDSAWLSGWDYRVELQIADYAGDIGASVTWFPVTVSLTSTQGEEVFVELTTDAEYLKVAFTKADGTTELYAEKELFDVSEQKGIFHVSRTGWTIDANTSVYMYYDKDHADNTTYIGAITARTEVWDGNFKAVYHMVDDNGNVDDSTSNNNDGTKLGAGEPVEVTGKVGRAQDFDGADDYINSGNDATLQLGASDVTVEATVKNDAATGSGKIINKENADTTLDIEYNLDIADKKLRCQRRDSNGDIIAVVSSGDVYGASFYYVVGTINNTTHTINLFINGSADGTDTNVNSGDAAAGRDLHIGQRNISTGYSDRFDGIIDEARISSTIRSTAWIKGTYNSLFDSLLTYGSEETEVVVEEVNALFWANF